jgi:hypothetical protein
MEAAGMALILYFQELRVILAQYVLFGELEDRSLIMLVNKHESSSFNLAGIINKI